MRSDPLRPRRGALQGTPALIVLAGALFLPLLLSGGDLRGQAFIRGDQDTRISRLGLQSGIAQEGHQYRGIGRVQVMAFYQRDSRQHCRRFHLQHPEVLVLNNFVL